MQTLTLTFQQVAEKAGFAPGPDGKLNLAATQQTANALAAAAASLAPWQPGDDDNFVIYRHD